MALDDGLAHVGNAGHDGIAGEVGLDGGDGGVLDVARRGEVGLARAEIDEVGALGAQLGGLGGHGHGRGDFDAADALGKDFLRSYNGHVSSSLPDFPAHAKFEIEDRRV
jgi:hypothetical protein